jgi:hypothetical protein
MEERSFFMRLPHGFSQAVARHSQNKTRAREKVQSSNKRDE